MRRADRFKLVRVWGFRAFVPVFLFCCTFLGLFSGAALASGESFISDRGDNYKRELYDRIDFVSEFGPLSLPLEGLGARIDDALTYSDVEDLVEAAVQLGLQEKLTDRKSAHIAALDLMRMAEHIAGTLKKGKDFRAIGRAYSNRRTSFYDAKKAEKYLSLAGKIYKADDVRPLLMEIGDKVLVFTLFYDTVDLITQLTEIDNPGKKYWYEDVKDGKSMLFCAIDYAGDTEIAEETENILFYSTVKPDTETAGLDVNKTDTLNKLPKKKKTKAVFKGNKLRTDRNETSVAEKKAYKPKGTIIIHNYNSRYDLLIYVNEVYRGTAKHNSKPVIIEDITAGKIDLAATNGKEVRWGPRQVFLGKKEVFHWKLY